MPLKSTFRNFLYLFSGDIAGRLLGFVATTYLARILGSAGFGVISIGLAVLSYAMILGNSGLTFLGTRKLAAEPDTSPEFTGRILSARFIISAAVFVIGAGISCRVIRSPETANVTFIYLLYLFPAAFMLDWFFQACRQMGVISLSKVIGMLSYLMFVLLFVHAAGDVIKVAWGWTVGGIANLVLQWILFIRQGKKIRIPRKHPRFLALLAEAFPLGIANLSSQFVVQFPVLYLGWFATASDVGIFSVAFRMTVLLLIFDRVFYTMFFPVISRHAHESRETLEIKFNRILKIVTVSALTVGLFAILSADFIITFLFSREYSESVLIFRILTGYFMLTLIISVLGYTLIGMGYEKAFTRALLTGALTFFIAIFILPRFFAIIGVASALIFYELATLIVMVAELKKHLSFKFSRNLLAPFSGTFLVCLPVILSLNLALPLQLLLAILVCLPLIAWMGGIKMEEIKYFRKIFL